MFATNPPPKKTAPTAFLGGAVIGALGGLIGLGGAEFRLPLLIGAFGFPALQAVILNKAMSLIVVASALPFRATAVPFASVPRALVGNREPAGGKSVRRVVRRGMGDKAGFANSVSRHRDHAGIDRRYSSARP